MNQADVPKRSLLLKLAYADPPFLGFTNEDNYF